MPSLFRRFSVLLGSIGLAVLLASCTDRSVQPIATPLVSAIKPAGPAFGYSPVHGCDNLTPATMCTGSLATNQVTIEQLRVCKVYPSGNGPDVQIALNADYVQFQDGPQQSTFTVKSGQCLTLWRNGEEVNGVRSTDIVTVTELPVPGYTSTSQVTTIIRDQPGSGQGRRPSRLPSVPVTSATTVTTNIGGDRVPGALVVFTNTAIPVNQQPTPIVNGPYFRRRRLTRHVQQRRYGRPGRRSAHLPLGLRRRRHEHGAESDAHLRRQWRLPGDDHRRRRPWPSGDGIHHRDHRQRPASADGQRRQRHADVRTARRVHRHVHGRRRHRSDVDVVDQLGRRFSGDHGRQRPHGDADHRQSQLRHEQRTVHHHADRDG